MTSAFVHTDPSGRLTADSTLTVEGQMYPIPERGYFGPPEDRKPSRMFSHRVATALETAGFKPRHQVLGGPDADGAIEIEVERA